MSDILSSYFPQSLYLKVTVNDDEKWKCIKDTQSDDENYSKIITIITGLCILPCYDIHSSRCLHYFKVTLGFNHGLRHSWEKKYDSKNVVKFDSFLSLIEQINTCIKWKFERHKQVDWKGDIVSNWTELQ